MKVKIEIEIEVSDSIADNVKPVIQDQIEQGIIDVFFEAYEDGRIELDEDTLCDTLVSKYEYEKI